MLTSLASRCSYSHPKNSKSSRFHRSGVEGANIVGNDKGNLPPPPAAISTHACLAENCSTPTKDKNFCSLQENTCPRLEQDERLDAAPEPGPRARVNANAINFVCCGPSQGTRGFHPTSGGKWNLEKFFMHEGDTSRRLSRDEGYGGSLHEWMVHCRFLMAQNRGPVNVHGGNLSQ